MASVYDFTAETIDGAPAPLGDYRDKVLLIVNTASQCGFTRQYAGLEALYRKYRDRGLVVLGFPCNQFGAQEPGDAEVIERFCQQIYDIRFPIFAKIAVNGPEAHPLYGWLTQKARGVLGTRSIKWNFTKFLVGTDGVPIKRYGSTTKPEKIKGDIEKALKG